MGRGRLLANGLAARCEDAHESGCQDHRGDVVWLSIGLREAWNTGLETEILAAIQKGVTVTKRS